MNNSPDTASRHWLATVYYASIDIRCPMDQAWGFLLEYQVWNPHFAGVIVTPVRGNPGSEGEVVLIKDVVSYLEGEPPPEFYAETVKVLPPSRIVWRVYPTQGESFCNFVDFGLSKTESGVKFNVGYYEQIRLEPEKLKAHRAESEIGYTKLVEAFKAYAESDV